MKNHQKGCAAFTGDESSPCDCKPVLDLIPPVKDRAEDLAATLKQQAELRRIDRWTVTMRVIGGQHQAEVLIWYGYDTSGDAGEGDPSGQRSKSQILKQPSRIALIAEVVAYLFAEGA